MFSSPPKRSHVACQAFGEKSFSSTSKDDPITTRFSLETALERLGELYRRFGLEPRPPARGSQAARAVAAGARSAA